MVGPIVKARGAGIRLPSTGIRIIVEESTDISAADPRLQPDIQKQFIVESVLLTGIGGLLGVAGAAMFSFVIGKIMSGVVGDEFSAPVQLWAVAVAVVSSTLVGLAAGIYPASRAAALDPVVALRSE